MIYSADIQQQHVKVTSQYQGRIKKKSVNEYMKNKISSIAALHVFILELFWCVEVKRCGRGSVMDST